MLLQQSLSSLNLLHPHFLRMLQMPPKMSPGTQNIHSQLYRLLHKNLFNLSIMTLLYLMFLRQPQQQIPLSFINSLIPIEKTVSPFHERVVNDLHIASKFGEDLVEEEFEDESIPPKGTSTINPDFDVVLSKSQKKKLKQKAKYSSQNRVHNTRKKGAHTPRS